MASITGRPRVDANLVDLSAFGDTSRVGTTAVSGETERGEFNVPILCKNWSDFQTNFGGLPENWKVSKDTLFPVLAKRVLDYGVPLIVSRIEHYATITDNTSGTSTFSTSTVASIIFTATQAGDWEGTLTIKEAASKLVDKFDISIDVEGYSRLSKTVSNVSKVIDSAEADRVEAALELVRPSAGTIDMLSGVTSIPVFANSTNLPFATFTETAGSYVADAASAISEAYSSVTLNVIKGTKYKITANLTTGDLTGYSIRLATANDGTGVAYSNTVDFNGESILTVAETGTVYLNIVTDITAGAANFDTLVLEEQYVTTNSSLAGGNYDVAGIINADYIGNQTAGNGIYAFDDEDDVRRICIMHKASNDLDVALTNYVEARGLKMRAILHTPNGLTGFGAVDYREGEGAYTGNTVIDNHLCSLTFGGVVGVDPTTNLDVNYTEVADVLAMKGLREIQANAWDSAAGQKYLLSQTSSVVYNLGTAGRATEADAVDTAGVNSVISDRSVGQYINGISTLQKEDTLLKFENISELVVDIVHTFSAIAKKYLLSYPNDIETWGDIYKEFVPYLDILNTTGRAVWNYKYEGDQEASQLSDAVINNDSTDLDAGIYKVVLTIYPKSPLKYVRLDLTTVNGVTAPQVFTN